ncbi:3-oxoacyl-[acyl-carrier-protein] synthase 3 [Streptomyces lucensis JCM 4490]|uniref:Beta-ketoacyl-[acyl-carrier-protein] synthase III n=1 Tax=Streptomyces lucensis JCM 4490 TaxID=1306176 RepID=A0A918JGD6_9ACTN|nr:beta-ketoacyl-ACP synthase III [Streptomyces lucensis]GGW79635.1 3-oxoacyl-[acyl-carrier-protein] synthase 3 [Streptomyces lucensis JCM 4490]
MTRSCVVEALAGWVPPLRVTNDQLPESWGVTDSWVRSRTGIGSRHRAGHGVATSDLALAAAESVLRGNDSVDALLLTTSTPDHPLPATAPSLAARLGLGPIPAFDVSAVCSGFVYALATAAGWVAAGLAERVLLVAADVYSTMLDPTDRAAGIVFGDGAGAVLLRRGEDDEPGALIGFDLGSDGGHADLIMVPAGGARHRATGRSPADGDHYFRMHGSEVFKHAITRMDGSVSTLLESLGWSVDEVDRLVGHQANARILKAVCERLGLPADRCVGNLAEVGNTGAASIPLALAQAHADGRLRPGQRVVVAAFGGGLTWGSAALVWPDLSHTQVIPHL